MMKVIDNSRLVCPGAGTEFVFFSLGLHSDRPRSFNDSPLTILPSFTEFYRVSGKLIQFHHSLAGGTEFNGIGPKSLWFYRVWPRPKVWFVFNITFKVLPSFTGLYRVLPVFLGFTGFYRVLPSFTEFYLVLPSFTEFYRAIRGWIELNRVEPSFTEFYRVLAILVRRRPCGDRPGPLASFPATARTLICIPRCLTASDQSASILICIPRRLARRSLADRESVRSIFIGLFLHPSTFRHTRLYFDSLAVNIHEWIGH